MDFARFDARHYETLPVRAGYAEWAATYDATVVDELDLRLLQRCAVEWKDAQRALDLACGTGRTGVWLKGHGVRSLDGVDCTPDMLARAQATRAYDRLVEGDIRATGLASATYDLVAVVLADEHLPALPPLYDEAARLLTARGTMVVVGYHPHFLLNGIPTHFDREGGEPVAIEVYVHLLSDHPKAAQAAGLSMLAMDESVVDDALVAIKPGWARYAGHPVTFSMTFRR